MARRLESSLATLLLSSRAVPSETKPLSATEYWKLAERIDDLALLFTLDRVQQEELLGTDLASRVDSLLDRATAIAFKVEELEQRGIATITACDDDYPSRWRQLGSGAPPVLHAVGPVALLESGGIAIVGSRNISLELVDVARAAAAHCARGRITVISGGARGTDKLAMQAAVDAGGNVVGVLADALLRIIGDVETRRAISDEQVCLATPYGPEAPFSAGNAMGRNKLVYLLSDAAFVVATDEGKGGTWSGAVEALKKRYARVAAWVGADAPTGNLALVERGAIPISSVDELDRLQSDPHPVERSEQLGLGLGS